MARRRSTKRTWLPVSGLGSIPCIGAARDVLALAVGWGKPADDTLQEQWSTELFYRFQLVERLAITPSLQYIVNPASNPEETEVWLFGLRGRLTF